MARVPASAASFDAAWRMRYAWSVSIRNLRVEIVLEPQLFAVVKQFAREHGASLAQEAQDLIRDAIELHEDRALDGMAELRRSSWNRRTALTATSVRAQSKHR